MRIVFDSNIYVAAAISKGLSYNLLNYVLKPENDFLLYISDAILDEVAEKLKFFREKGLVNDQRIQEVQRAIQDQARHVIPKGKIKAVKDDPDDNKILECAVAAEANIIITMDKHLLKLKIFRNIAVVHPKTFSYIMPKK